MRRKTLPFWIRVYDLPMRIRTDGDNQYRKEVIESAAEELGCNKTRAVVVSCDLVGRVIPRIERALNEADIRPSEAEQIAETITGRHVEVTYERGEVSVNVD